MITSMFKMLMFIVLSAQIGPQTQIGGPGRYYDSKGNFQSQVNKNSSVYSQNGSYLGRQDSRSTYNSSGSRTGNNVTSGNTTRFYSSSGKYEGRAVTNGSTTRFYDSKGSATGTATKGYGSTTFRGPTNKYEGIKRK